jgi:hypothetical protein
MEKVVDLPDGCYEMTKEHLEVARNIFTEGFLGNNEIWSSYNLTRENLSEFFANMLSVYFESQERCRKAYGEKYTLHYVSVC